MLFGKYHIVIFKERTGKSKNLRLRGWLGICCFLVFVGLLGGNVWFWERYKEVGVLKGQLNDAKRVIEEQNNSILGLVSTISLVQEDLGRVTQFDSKLRVMMNMEKDVDLAATGGSRTDDFAKGYLPLHRQELLLRKINAFLKQLSDEVRLEEVQQQDLLQALRANRDILASLPTVWPVEGFLTSRFGNRSSPFTGRPESHKGLDISARLGTPIYVPGRGKVTFAGSDGAYGNSVVIQHGGGITTRYAHMQRFLVKDGQIVQRGELLGFVGNTGRSSGPHLHYEVLLNGANVNPMRYILN